MYQPKRFDGVVTCSGGSPWPPLVLPQYDHQRRSRAATASRPHKLRRHRYFFTLALIVAFVCVAGAQQKPPAPESWKEVRSTEGGFSVSMPGDPQRESEPTDTDAGRVEIHSYVLETDLGTYYVSYTVFPQSSDEPSAVKAVLEAARDEQVARGAKLLNDREATLPGGIIGLEWLVESEGLILRNRTFFVKGRLYQILFVTTPEVAFKNGKASSNANDRTTVFEEIASRFHGSFKLLPETQAMGEVDTLLLELRGKGTEVYGTRLVENPDGADTNSQVLNGRALSLPKPAYPPIARQARASGTVSVQVVISEEGEVIGAQWISGHPLLAAVSVAAARQATFSPTLLDGKPVKVVGVITYAFLAQ